MSPLSFARLQAHTEERGQARSQVSKPHQLPKLLSPRPLTLMPSLLFSYQL